jgi:uncharacterized protein
MTLTVQTLRRRLTHVSVPAAVSELSAEEFSGYASLFGVPDGGGDVVAKGAFAASLRRIPPEKVRLLYQHFAHEPIGVWEEIREDAKGLYVRGRLIPDVQRSREVMALIREGAVGGLSIGFKTIRATRDAKTGHRILNEIELWEISVVTFPLLRGSAVTAIGAKTDPLAAHIRRAGRCICQSNKE